MLAVMKSLYFVRHGESEHNVDGLFAGSSDTKLTKQGLQQAKLVGKEAKKLNIDLVVSSPLERTYATAKAIAQEMKYNQEKIITHDLLKERFYGTAELTPYSTKMNHLDSFSHYETDDEVQKRAKELLKWLKTLKAQNILIVSHGAIGRRLRKLLKPEHDFYERIPNAKLERWL
jgi:broad specificity phosphatase PhoE